MTSVRESQLQQIKNVTHFLSHQRFKIELHTNKLKAFLRKLQREKHALVLNPKRRRILLNPAIKRPRMIYDTLSPPSKILKRRIHEYKAIDNYIYGLLLCARKLNHDSVSDKALRYHVNINFMCRLRSGLFIKQENGIWDQAPFLFESTCNVRKNIPLGLALLIIGLGIPDKCTKAMFSDISRFALNLPPSNATLSIEIRIATMQLEGEDVIGTKYRAVVDQICRSLYIDRVIIRKEANLQPLKLLDALSSSSYNNMIGEEDGKEEDCCSICLQELRGGCNSSLPCSHVYHYDCIFKWMSKYNSCPMCRHPYQRLFHPIRTIKHQNSSHLS